MTIVLGDRRIEAITFDCYGTLIDWETGIMRAFGRVLGAAATAARRDEVLRLYARHERAVEDGPYLPYRTVLAEVCRRVSRELGASVGEEACLLFGESIRDWPAFDESPAMLAAMGATARLAVLSNIDDDLFEWSRARLGVGFETMVTAEQVRSYKPRTAHFLEGMRRLGVGADQILHVAESRFHDVAPAKSLGMATVWVNRHAGSGSSASGESDVTPDVEVRSLTELVRRLMEG